MALTKARLLKHDFPVHGSMLVHSGPSTVLWPFLRKLGKAVAVSGVLAGVLEESPGKILGKSLENFSRIAKCYKFFKDLRHRERQACREPWVHTAGTLSPPSVRGLF